MGICKKYITKKLSVKLDPRSNSKLNTECYRNKIKISEEN